MGSSYPTKNTCFLRGDLAESVKDTCMAHRCPFLACPFRKALHLLQGHLLIGLKLQSDRFTPVGPLPRGSKKQMNATDFGRTQKRICTPKFQLAPLQAHPSRLCLDLTFAHC